LSSDSGFFSFNLWVFLETTAIRSRIYNQMQFLFCYFSIVMRRQRNLLLICLDIFCLVFAASIFTTPVKKIRFQLQQCLLWNILTINFNFSSSKKIFVWLESSRGQRFVSRCYSTFYDSDLVWWKIFKFSDSALLFVNFQNWHNR
jgi:hypothetical protein